MPALRQKALQVVPAPLIEVVPQAPLAPETPNPTVEFTCGNCGAVLPRFRVANDGVAPALVAADHLPIKAGPHLVGGSPPRPQAGSAASSR